jgi:hypothetical protein
MSLLLSSLQQEIADFPEKGFLVVTGQAGTGKTAASVERLQQLCSTIEDPDTILILAPQRSLANPYWQAIRSPEFLFPAPHAIMTVGGLAQRSIALFWPLIAREAGFKLYKRPPVFLTLELTQFFLARLIDPLIQKGYFSSISIDRLRLYSQIIDNLNKSAVVGFDPTSISEKLTSAWVGKSDQTSIFDQVQECSLLFRKYCFEHNLLDFSLQIQVFRTTLWKSFIFRQYLKTRYQHLIYENVEEDFPVAHDIVEDWLPDFKSVVINIDENGGFRTFLGADPVSANRFLKMADRIITLNKTFTSPDEISIFSTTLTEAILNHSIKQAPQEETLQAYEVQSFRFVPQTIEAVALQVKHIIEDEHVSPGEIAILTPYLSDAMLFSTLERFSSQKIPISAFRPSRGLKDEPAVKAILTLSKLAFPSMGLIPEKEDVRNALMTVITGCDLIRADLLTQMVFSVPNGQPFLRLYDPEKNTIRERISREVGSRFEHLRQWLISNSESNEIELDVFWGRLFGELLSQQGYNFNTDLYQSTLVNQLIQSSRKFRQTLSADGSISENIFSKTYIELVESGLLSTQYFEFSDSLEPKDCVQISPAHSFLMRNKPVSYQFWLEIGSPGWWARLDQPLTQPYVLNRNWKEGSHWTDIEEFNTNQNNLARVVSGLLARCKKKVILVSVDINQQGDEQRGALMVALQTLLKRIHREGNG